MLLFFINYFFLKITFYLTLGLLESFSLMNTNLEKSEMEINEEEICFCPELV